MADDPEDLISAGRRRWAEAAFGFDKGNIPALEQAASLWRSAGQHFYAGYAMDRAAYLAIGDNALMVTYATAAIADLRAAASAGPPGAPETLAAIWKMARVLDHFYVGDALVRTTIRELHAELAQRFLAYFAEFPGKESYLVRGVVFHTDLAGHWDTILPDYDRPGEGESYGLDTVAIGVPSAFQLFMGLGDYAGGQQVIELCPDSFATAELRGWRYVTQAFLRPDDAPSLFAKASGAFAEDNAPGADDLRKRGSWSSINIELWTKYFRARSALARSAKEPHRIRDLIAEAAGWLRGTDHGWVDQRVTRLAVLVTVLHSLLGEGAGADVDSARRELSNICSIFGREPEDEMELQFSRLAQEALEEFRSDPALAITSGRLHLALDLLRRLPLIEAHVTEAIIPAIGAKLVAEIHGPMRTWIYRTLQGISDEKQLQRILLRLAQASIPVYAQILHGPIEYGKDVAVVIDLDGRRVLRMYQLKCGDINLAKWREAKDELEEMFSGPFRVFRSVRSQMYSRGYWLRMDTRTRMLNRQCKDGLTSRGGCTGAR
jgi:hypothetical protein